MTQISDLAMKLTSFLDELISEKVNKAISEKEITENQTQGEDLMDVRETADFLKLSVNSIYLLSRTKKIPTMRQGKKVYFSKNEIREWMKQGRRKTTAELLADAKNFKTKKG